MYILGISAFYHDSAACLIKNGEILSAVQEERFSRIKNDSAFPAKAVEFCLKNEDISINDISYIAYYEKPFLKFERILESYLARSPFGIRSFLKSMRVWLKEKIWLKDIIRKKLNYTGEILFTKHHEAHAASAFFASPFKDAAFLTIDGAGEWQTTTFGIGEGNAIKTLGEIKFPHSLGLLYSAFTYFLGFKVNSDEYKVMGLAPFGKPVYKKLILDKIVDLKRDGSFKLNMKYFNYISGLKMTNKRFYKLFGISARKPSSVITQNHMNIARSIQEVTEEMILRMVKHIKKITNKKYLCLAGGVALNCVANGKILKENIFEDIFIQPAAGDSGGALGAALCVWYRVLQNKRSVKNKKDIMKGAFLGPVFSDKEIEQYLKEQKAVYQKLNISQVPALAAKLIHENKTVGWFQGKMEFGLRALGARSILANAKDEKMHFILNMKIKNRENFRPFAPAVLAEDAAKYFDLKQISPYMLLTASVKKTRLKKTKKENALKAGFDMLKVIRSDIPSVTHVDNSARIQTVHKETNPVFYNLLTALKKNYGYSVVINTSFNAKDEPIVCGPDDAYKCFQNTGLDYLIMGSYLIKKQEI